MTLTASQVTALFSTRLHEQTEIGDSAVIFGTVDLNIGDGYDEFTGIDLFLHTNKKINVLNGNFIQ